MLTELEAKLSEALELALQGLPIGNNEYLPVLIEGWVVLAEALEEPIEFFCEMRSLKTVPSILELKTGQSEWEWAIASAKDLAPETVVKVSLEQTLHWTITIQTTEGTVAQLEVELERSTANQIQWAKQIVESALKYKRLKVFQDSDSAWEDYVLSLETQCD